MMIGRLCIPRLEQGDMFCFFGLLWMLVAPTKSSQQSLSRLRIECDESVFDNILPQKLLKLCVPQSCRESFLVSV